MSGKGNRLRQRQRRKNREDYAEATAPVFDMTATDFSVTTEGPVDRHDDTQPPLKKPNRTQNVLNHGKKSVLGDLKAPAEDSFDGHYTNIDRFGTRIGRVDRTNREAGGDADAQRDWRADLLEERDAVQEKPLDAIFKS